MIENKVTITNKLGLHARAAAKFVSTASSFGCEVRAGVNGNMVDGKSIMSIMMLAASRGSELCLQCDGRDEEGAMQALLELINNRFDEAE